MEDSKNTAPTQGSVDKFEVDLLALGRVLWNERRTFALRGLLCAALGLGISFLLPRIFQSQALLIPVAGGDQDKLSSLAGQLGGLASLAGLPIPTTSRVDKTQLALETLKSREFLAKFARNRGIDVALFAGESWNGKEQKWSVDSSIYDEANKRWVRKPRGMLGAEPSPSEIQERLLRKHLDVQEDKKTGLIKLSMKAPAPELAKTWLEELIKEINDYGRQREISEKEQNISYLLEQVQKTDIAELRQVFFTLIQRQQSDLMIANTQREFVFKTVDPPMIPIRKISPSRLQFLIAGFLLALGASFFETAVRRNRGLWLKPSGAQK